MPKGHVKRFDPSDGRGSIEHAGREYAVDVTGLPRDARTSGAPVHFDISHRDAGDVGVLVPERRAHEIHPKQVVEDWARYLAAGQTDRAAGADAVIERRGDGYRLRTAGEPPPTDGLAALHRGRPWPRRRAYRRYDGHYGLIVPAIRLTTT